MTAFEIFFSSIVNPSLLRILQVSILLLILFVNAVKFCYIGNVCPFYIGGGSLRLNHAYFFVLEEKLILSASNIQKSFGAKEILRSGSFLINEQEKAAIVGINGAGKTTLLKILTGEESADSGTVSLAKNASLGYLAQINHVDSNASILEEMLEVTQ